MTYFGQAVAISGDTLLVGAPWEMFSGRTAQGAVYVYRRVGTAFVIQQKLVASDPAVRAFFGASIAIEGDTAIVGRAAGLPALSPDQARGSAYIFVREGGVWSEQAKLTPNDAQPRDHFGSAVDVSGDTALVAAGGKEAGYVYVRSGNVWLQQAKLLPNEPRSSFGGGGNDNGVALEGDTAIVGAPGDVGTNPYQGAVYVFVRTAGNWALQKKLTAAAATSQQMFGQSVAFSGDTLLVGSWRLNSVRVFLRQADVWSEQAPLPNTDVSWGHALAIEGDTALARGFRIASDESTSRYFLYVYRRASTGWNALGELRASDGPGLHWGFDVALAGDVAVAGAPTYPPDNQGAAYVFSVPPGTLGGVPSAPTLTAAVNGLAVTLSWTPSPAGDTPTSYILRAGTAPGSSNLFDANVGLTTTVASAVGPGTYYVRVSAVNAAGVSLSSNEITLVVGGAPGAPTVTSANASGGILTFSWAAGASPVPTSHRLDFYAAAALVATVNAGAETSIGIPIPPAIQGTFGVRVTAHNGTVEGPASALFTFTIGSACTVPGSPNVSGAVVGGTASVSWPAVRGCSLVHSLGGDDAGLDAVFGADQHWRHYRGEC